MSEAIELIRSANRAFNAGDSDSMVALFDPEIEFVDHLPLPDVAQAARRKDEVRAVFEAWAGGFAELAADVLEYLDLGHFVVCVTKWRFVSQDEGIELEWRGAEAYEIRDGKIVWAQAGFPDKQTAIEAVQARSGSGLDPRL